MLVYIFIFYPKQGYPDTRVHRYYNLKPYLKPCALLSSSTGF